MSEMYSQRLLDHYRHPRNKGSLEQGEASEQILVAEEYNPLCGDRVTIEVRVADGQVAEACFEGRGCALCLGAASILTGFVQGHSLDELEALDQDQFLAELEASIRRARLKCALLPWIAFRRAVFGEDEWLD